MRITTVLCPGWLQRRLLSVLSALGFLSAVTACSTVQLVPIQLGRIQQMETFQHTFEFSNALPAREGSATREDEPRVITQYLNARIDDKMNLLLGSQNWQTLKNLYGLGELRDELVSGDIFIRGLLQYYITPDPYDHDRFLVEGTGRYFLIRQKTSAIMLTGDFFVGPETFQISDLRSGTLNFPVKLFTTRVPGEMTYDHKSWVKYQIKLDNSRAEDNIYALDYTRKHEVFLLKTEDEMLSAENRLGTLKLDAPSKSQRSPKLFDLRGIQYLRSDY